MQIRIKRITYENFKGIRKYIFDLSGKSVAVLGKNGSGKTTLSDGFHWALFGKDSRNQADFEVKTLDPAGNSIHGLDHSVEVVLEVQGNEVSLKRTYREVFTKRRGEAEKTFTGHSSEYHIDGVPAKQKDYLAKVSELGDEDTLRLLTSPAYFNEQLSWQDRRKIVLEVGGNVTDEEVIASKSILADLPKILGKHSIDDYRKIIKAQQQGINKDLESIPTRIDEATRNRPDVPGDEAELTTQSEVLQQRIDNQEDELRMIRSGGQAVLKEREIVTIETELQKIRNEVEGEGIQKINQQKLLIQDMELACNRLDGEVFNAKRKVEDLQKIAQDHLDKTANFRSEWGAIDAEKFVWDGSDSCVSCGQPLPADKIAEAEAKAAEAFNLNKSQRIEKIIADGTASVDTASRYNEEANKLIAEGQEKQRQLETKRAELERAKHELSLLQANLCDVSQDERYQAKVQELKQARESLSNIRETERASERSTQAILDELKHQQKDLQIQLAKFETVRDTNKRIEELKAKEKTLSFEYARLEREIHLLEEFEKTKVSMMENRINSKFKLARFKLFNVYNNGGIDPTCETMLGGVPYGSLNTAGRVQVGLDIISTLQQHHDLYAPCWLDNRESVLEIPDMACQTISLVVSAEYKELTVQKAGETSPLMV